MTKRCEAFEKWAKNYGFEIKRWNDGSYMSNDTGYAYEAWQAAQADKLEFAQRVANRVLCTAYNAIHDSEEYLCNGDLPSVDINAIIAEVEQDQ